MEKEKIASVAKKLGVSTQAVYKKLVKLGDQVATELIKENGVTYLTAAGVEMLTASFAHKPAIEVSTVDNLVATLQKTIEEKQSMILNQQEMLKQLFEKQAEERQRTDSIIMKLAHDLEDTRRSALAIEMKVNTLLPKHTEIDQAILNQPPKPVAVWTPPARKDPLERAGVFEKVWAYFMEPERMRSRCAP